MRTPWKRCTTTSNIRSGSTKPAIRSRCDELGVKTCHPLAQTHPASAERAELALRQARPQTDSGCADSHQSLVTSHELLPQIGPGEGEAGDPTHLIRE